MHTVLFPPVRVANETGTITRVRLSKPAHEYIKAVVGRVESISDAQAAELAQVAGVSRESVHNYIGHRWGRLIRSITEQDLKKFSKFPAAKLRTLVKRYLKGDIKGPATCKIQAAELDLKFAPVKRWFQHRQARDREEARTATSEAVLRQRALDAIEVAQPNVQEPDNPVDQILALHEPEEGEMAEVEVGLEEPADGVEDMELSTPEPEPIPRAESPDIPLSDIVARQVKDEIPTPSDELLQRPSLSQAVKMEDPDVIPRSRVPSPLRPSTPDSSAGRPTGGRAESPFDEVSYEYSEKGTVKVPRARSHTPFLLLLPDPILQSRVDRPASSRFTTPGGGEIDLRPQRSLKVHVVREGRPYPLLMSRKQSEGLAGFGEASVSSGAGSSRSRIAEATRTRFIQKTMDGEEIEVLKLDAKDKKILELQNKLARRTAGKPDYL